MKPVLFKILFYASLLILAGYGYIWVIDQASLGPLLVIGLLAFSVGIRMFDSLKGLTYTILILASVSAALHYPEYFLSVGDFELKRTIIPLLQVIMFGMGSQMSLRDFEGVIKSPKAVIIGVICQFTIMPLVALALITTFSFPSEIAAGIILVGASPSGLASNVMSFLAKANIALSVTLTAIATVLAPVLTSFIMQLLAGELIPINVSSMMIGIMNMVILPIVAGLLFNTFAFGYESFKKAIPVIVISLIVLALKNTLLTITEGSEPYGFVKVFSIDLVWFMLLPILAGIGFKRVFGADRDLIEKALSLISMLGIGVIITIITSAGRDNLIEIGGMLLLACFLHNLLGYFIGYWLSRIFGVDPKSCRTIALEVGMQNGGLASGIALQLGKVATVGLAPSVFGPLMNITGSSLATLWRDRPLPDTSD